MHLQETHEEPGIRSESSGLWWPVDIGGAEHSCAYDVRFPVKFRAMSPPPEHPLSSQPPSNNFQCRIVGFASLQGGGQYSLLTIKDCSFPLSLRFNLDCATTECLRLYAGREHVGPSYWLAVHTTKVLLRNKKLG